MKNLLKIDLINKSNHVPVFSASCTPGEIGNPDEEPHFLVICSDPTGRQTTLRFPPKQILEMAAWIHKVHALVEK